jgi:hypothetical protein
MTVEERIEAADRRRVDGNELFKEDKLQEAVQQYEMVSVIEAFYETTRSSTFLNTHTCKESGCIGRQLALQLLTSE